MSNKLQIKRGLKNRLPSLAEGEFGWCTDTKELYIGNGDGNALISEKTVTTNRALVSNGSGKVAVSDVTATELGYLDGVTSNVQTQLDGKAPTSHAVSGTTYGVGSSSNYGHVKLSDSTSSSLSTTDGTAATPKAVKAAYDLANGKADATHSHNISNVTGLQDALNNKTRTATLVIAASNSTAKSKAAADYTCSGSGDQSQITSALNALSSTGGKIVFLEGTYNISSAFTISKNVVFEGMGDGTQINVSGSLATCSNAVSVVFRDMKITANTISKYLYKGGGSDNVLLDNVTLIMTATGVHNLQTTDTEAAFLKLGKFTAVNSRISVKATETPNCYAIADGTASRRVVFDNCDITLDGTYGRMHVGRCYTDMNSCRINIVHPTSSADHCLVGGVGNTMTGGELNVSNSSSDAWLAQDALSYGSYFGVYITLKSQVTYSNANNYTVFVGCHLHNFTVTGGTNVIANLTV